MKNKYPDKVYSSNNPVGKTPVTWRVMAMLLAIILMQVTSGLAQAPARHPVSGKVTSPDGQGLPGVSIIIKGTTNGVASDVEGNYTIEAANTDVLVVSYIGFVTQEVTVGARTQLNVALKEDQKVLNEVVVTGYGELRRVDVPGAQTTISSKAIEKTVNTTIEQAIQGRAPGVYITQNTGAPGGGISVNIRGVNSINGSNEPLYVIDGVQIQGSVSPSGSNPLSTLNPSDIESMEVLQGPSATAIYGSKATNGVVIVTTKRGKSGEVRVNYTYLYSLQTAPKSLDVMSLQQYAQMENEYKAIAGGTVREEFLDPSLLGEGTNWQKELFTDAGMQKHQVSLSGGSDKTTYYLSGENLNQEGIALGSGFNRSSVRLNLDNQARKWLTLGANLSFSQTDEKLSTNQNSIITSAIQMGPQIAVRNLNGSYGGGTVTATNTAEQFAPANPIGLANITTNELTRRQFLGGLNTTFHILPGLDFRSSFNTTISYSNSTYYLPTYQFGYQKNENATLSNTDGINTFWSWNQMLQYDKQIGKHHINAMFTHESQEYAWKNITAQRQGFTTNEVIDLNAGDLNQSSTAGGQGTGAMESYLGRINYNYADRYILQASFRTDGSSNFGAGNKWGYFPALSAAWRVTEEPFFNVPFFSDLRLRYETGLTGNQGSSGNIYGGLTTGPSEWGTSFRPANYPNPNFQWEETKTNNFGINIGVLENRIQLEADYYIKNTDNLIMPSALPWYMGTTGSGSVSAPTVNAGSLRNKGWSFSVNTININNSAFKWESNFNLSHFKTTITSLNSATGFYDRINWWMNNWTQRAAIGESPWLFYGYVEEGIFQSVEELQNSALPADNNGEEYAIAENSIWVGDVKYKDINGDGIITGDDQTYIGNPWPKYFAGLTNSLSYKGFDLSILITSTIGNDVYNYLRNENSNPNNINLGRNMFVSALDYAQLTTDAEGNTILANPGTTVARIASSSKNGNYSRHTNKYVEDGSFVRLKNVTLNYNLPATLLARQKFIKGARVGVSAQNVWTITGYSGYDPEVGSYVGANASTENAAIGVDYGRYPLTPVYSFNIGIDF